MAALSANERAQVWGEYMRTISRQRRSVNANKNQVKSAMDDLDDWLSTNQTNALDAITGPAGTNLSTEEKNELLCEVLNKRFAEGVT